MNNQLNKQISIAEVFSVVRTKWWVLGLCMVAFISSVIIYNQKAIPIYRASTIVKFEDAEAVMSAKFSNPLDKENFIANKIAEMKTKAFAEEVYEALPQQIRERFLQDSSYSIARNHKEYLVEQINVHLSVDPLKNTEIITINFEAQNPELAMAVANKAAHVLRKRDLSLKRKKDNDLLVFLREQFEKVSNRLQQVERESKEFKEKHKITSLETEVQETLRRFTEAEVLYNQVNSQRRELREKLNATKAELDWQSRNLADNMVHTADPLIELKQRLVEEETKYANLQLQGVPDYNTKMVEIKNRIAQIRQNLKQATIKLIDKDITSLMNPLDQIRSYLEKSITLELDLQATNAKAEYLRAVLDDYSKKLRQRPGIEMALARLMRERKTLTNTYGALSEKIEQVRINIAAELGNLRIIEAAALPEIPISPRKLINIGVAIFSSILFGSLLIFGIDYFNDSIRTEEDIEEALNVPVIAAIPRAKHDFILLSKHNGNGVLPKKNKKEPMLLDEYNLFYSALTHRKRRGCALMITSFIPNEGKSTISTMLAVISAQRGERTLLIDGDLRRPTLHGLFNVSRNPGLTNLALEFIRILKKKNSNEPTLDGVLTTEQMIQTALVKGLIQTFEENLLFLPSGFLPAYPVKAWSSNVWYQVFSHLKSMFDLIIIDTPPIIGIPDSTIMSSYVDNILLCVEANGIEKQTLERSSKMFKNAVKNSESKIIGAILNKADLVNQNGKCKYYKYYEHYAKKTIPNIPYSPKSAYVI